MLLLLDGIGNDISQQVKEKKVWFLPSFETALTSASCFEMDKLKFFSSAAQAQYFLQDYLSSLQQIFFFFFAYKGRIVEIVDRDDLHTEKCSFGEDDEHWVIF